MYLIIKNINKLFNMYLMYYIFFYLFDKIYLIYVKKNVNQKWFIIFIKVVYKLWGQ